MFIYIYLYSMIILSGEGISVKFVKKNDDFIPEFTIVSQNFSFTYIPLYNLVDFPSIKRYIRSYYNY